MLASQMDFEYYHRYHATAPSLFQRFTRTGDCGSDPAMMGPLEDLVH